MPSCRLSPAHRAKLKGRWQPKLNVGDTAEIRKKHGRRKNIDPTTCERKYTPEEIEFAKAMQRFKDDRHRTRTTYIPTVTDVLAVAHSLGYRKVVSTDTATDAVPV